jgi:hypothetical protein
MRLLVAGRKRPSQCHPEALEGLKVMVREPHHDNNGRFRPKKI